MGWTFSLDLVGLHEYWAGCLSKQYSKMILSCMVGASFASRKREEAHSCSLVQVAPRRLAADCLVAYKSAFDVFGLQPFQPLFSSFNSPCLSRILPYKTAPFSVYATIRPVIRDHYASSSDCGGSPVHGNAYWR